MMHPRGEVSPRTKAYRLRDSEIGLPHVLSVVVPGGGNRVIRWTPAVGVWRGSS
jgi:hypothetical protein